MMRWSGASRFVTGISSCVWNFHSPFRVHGAYGFVTPSESILVTKEIDSYLIRECKNHAMKSSEGENVKRVLATPNRCIPYHAGFFRERNVRRSPVPSKGTAV